MWIDVAAMVVHYTRTFSIPAEYEKEVPNTAEGLKAMLETYVGGSTAQFTYIRHWRKRSEWRYTATISLATFQCPGVTAAMLHEELSETVRQARDWLTELTSPTRASAIRCTEADDIVTIVCNWSAFCSHRNNVSLISQQMQGLLQPPVTLHWKPIYIKGKKKMQYTLRGPRAQLCSV